MVQHLERLDGLHPDLQRVVRRALLGPMPFMILEGLRTIERQRKLYAIKATTTMKSRHLTGHAVDLGVLVDGELRWDWPLYHRLAVIVKQAAKDENVPIEAGADWKNFPDGPHYQLPWLAYPIQTPPAGTALVA